MQEHTGDIMMRICGSTVEKIFVHAAQGLMEYLYGEAVMQKTPTEQKTIALTSPDQESLLIDWLSELLYMSDTYHHMCLAYSISELSDTRLSATVGLIKAEAVEDVKAITYNELRIKKINDHYEATVVFDM